MLTTESYSISDAIGELDSRYDELEEKLDGLDESTDEHDTLRSRRDRIQYLRNGLQWQRDEEGWDDVTIELGALTAGEKALMHREAPTNADRDEMRLWFVAASTEAAPYASDDLETTFEQLSKCHPAFVEWAEAKANSLGVPGDSGNRSSTPSAESESSQTSTTKPDSTTSSSSGSPTE